MSDTADQQDTPLDQEADQGQVELERRARNMGWRPRDEYRGIPDQWLPAEDFIERGESELPVLRERIRASDRTITELRDQVSRQGDTLNSMLQTARRAEQVGYRRAMQELTEKRQRAVEMGDTAAFAAVEQAMRELGPEPAVEPPRTPPPPQPQANTDPAIQVWVERNPWFKNDPVANVAMIAAMQKAERDMPSASVAEHLMEAEAVIRRRFPEHFERSRPRASDGNGSTQYRQERRPLHIADGPDEDEEEEPVREPQPRQRSSTVARSSDSPPPRRPGPRSFEAMPPEVRAQYDRQRKMLEGKGDPLTREEFASYYWEAEGGA